MAIAITNRKCFVILTTAILTTTLVMLMNKPTCYTVPTYQEITVMKMGTPTTGAPATNWRNLPKNKTEKMSVLGRIMYLDEPPPKVPRSGKTYEILVWKYGRTIENRHMKSFGKEYVDPFQYCSVRNCHITYNDAAAETADIIIFHLHRMKKDDVLPKRPNPDQIWAFLTDESPHHTFMSGNKLSNYNKLFNWSMTYRMDSDIPVPYGRTVPRKTPLNLDLTVTKRKDVLVAILGSNCGGNNKRWDYVRELQRHIQVDVYGHCGTLKTCPGHFKSNCHDIDSYMFYLAFENSNCDEYVTEKLWWNAFEKNAIPVVMGASKETYKQLLPPHSYLNVDDYAHPEDLAAYMLYLNRTGNYAEYFRWKHDYVVLNEHGYFQTKSYHYCRVCEALNYNKRVNKFHTNLEKFWNKSRDCHPAWNA